jgi:hypothetical protein
MILKGQPAQEEIRAALDRVLSSSSFRTRPALQRLLTYLVERTLEGSAGGLKEYAIGRDVFDKPPDYDPQTDAAVRVQISKLRQKLEEYYRTDGQRDFLLIDSPKRQFALEFHQREVAPEVVSRPVRRAVRARWWIFAACGLAAAAALAWTAWKRPSPAKPRDALAEIWAPFLTGDRPVLISLGTHQFYAYAGGYLREPTLDRADETAKAARLRDLARRLDSDRMAPSQIYTGIGQATGAFLLAKFFAGRGRDAQLTRSSALSWDDIGNNNVIFLGSYKSNAQLKDLPGDWTFRIEGETVRNLKPRPGEPASFGAVWGDGGSKIVDYALITLTAGLHRRGHIVAVESPSTAGVWAAVQYLTQTSYAGDLTGRLRGRDGRLPQQYQVVLRVHFKSFVPVEIRCVAHRAL